METNIPFFYVGWAKYHDNTRSKIFIKEKNTKYNKKLDQAIFNRNNSLNQLKIYKLSFIFCK